MLCFVITKTKVDNKECPGGDADGHHDSAAGPRKFSSNRENPLNLKIFPHGQRTDESAAFRAEGKSGSSEWPGETEMSKSLPDAGIAKVEGELVWNFDLFEEKAR